MIMRMFLQILEKQKKTYELNETETARYQKFIENHQTCLLGDKGLPNRFGAIGGGISITFSETAIGYFIRCNCEGCNQYANIIDVDNL